MNEIKKGKDIKARVSFRGFVLIIFSHNMLVKNSRASLTYNTEPCLALKFSFKVNALKLRPAIMV